MRTHTSINIIESNFAECVRLVESGQFDSLSDVVEHSMRVLYDSIKLDGSELSYSPRGGPKVKQSIRINGWLVDRFSELGMTGISEMADYSLSYYFRRINSSNEGF